jgi:hypothetical protein
VEGFKNYVIKYIMNDIESGLLTEQPVKKCHILSLRLIILCIMIIVAFGFLIYMMLVFYLKI